jgi:hypothetical protein
MDPNKWHPALSILVLSVANPPEYFLHLLEVSLLVISNKRNSCHACDFAEEWVLE